jgi:hypothetical protein
MCRFSLCLIQVNFLFPVTELRSIHFVAYFFVSSTDAMTGRQDGRFRNQLHLCEESPVVCCFGPTSLVVQQRWIACIWCLGLWHCIFEDCSFWNGSDTNSFACALYVEGRRQSGCSPTSRPSSELRSPTSRPTCSLSIVVGRAWSPWQCRTWNESVAASRSVSALTRST